jgi:hypothetical protein
MKQEKGKAYEIVIQVETKISKKLVARWNNIAKSLWDSKKKTILTKNSNTHEHLGEHFIHLVVFWGYNL